MVPLPAGFIAANPGWNVMKRASLSIGLAAALGAANAAHAQLADLAALSIEELAELRVTSVSRRPERAADAAASIYVITRADIASSGATSLPEALRLAPNLQVARADTVQYAISARGFNNAFGNKLLVLIDGRTVYTPLFSGVFWDQQDVLLEDVDRIEVISGPGATLWGANAVNGVINVITKPASETQGAFVAVGAGNLAQDTAVRYGGELGAAGSFRAYAKTTDLEHTDRASGAAQPDGWERAQVGFRADWDYGANGLTLQADAYGGESEDRGTIAGLPFGSVEVAGANILGRWTRELAGGSNLQVQAYVDRAERDDFLFFRPKAEILDVEAQHTVTVAAHNLVWGGGYRRAKDEINTGFVTAFIPRSRELDWQNVFVQDRLPLSDRLEATFGLKLETNDYTGTEHLPSARLAWKPAENKLLWSALSRAVRAPSRFDRDVFFPGTPPFLVIGGPNFGSEVANVLELGYRAQPTDSLSYSVTAYHHDWDKLRSGTSLPVQLVNGIEGSAAGVEAWATWQITRGWQLSGGFSTLDKDLRLKPGSTDPVGVNNETLANDGDYQWLLRSSWDLGGDFALELNVRHSEELPNPAVPDYTAIDASFAWQMLPRVAISATGHNLFDEAHPEFGPAPTRSELERAVYLRATVHFGP
jgi:iron complex outermembrane receptor protein